MKNPKKCFYGEKINEEGDMDEKSQPSTPYTPYRLVALLGVKEASFYNTIRCCPKPLSI